MMKHLQVLKGSKQNRDRKVGQGKNTWGGDSGSTILGNPLMNG